MDDHQVPPTAAQRICLDFDGTLFQWGELDGPFTVMPGASDAAHAFREAGFEIVIFTSRMSVEWLRESNRSPAIEVSLITQALHENDVPFDWITGSKVPARWYVDDRAIQFSPATGGWENVLRRVFG